MRTKLFAFGMLLLFVSWISQNYFENKWANEIEHLSRIQIEVIREVSRRDAWLIEYNNQVNKEPQNRPLLAQAAYSLSTSSLNIMTALSAASGKTYDTNIVPIFKKKKRVLELKELLDSKRYEKLIEKANQINEEYQSSSNSPRKLMEAWIDALVNKDKWNYRFLWCYIIGSVLLGISWLIKQLEPPLDLEEFIRTYKKLSKKHRRK